MRRTLLLSALASALLVSLPSQAQTYPNKPIRMIVPFAAGGSSDVMARGLGKQLAEQMGTQVVIENRPGGGGGPAMEAVVKSPADGHTLLYGTIGTNSVAPVLFKNLPVDPNRDLLPVSLLALNPSVLIVHAGLPIQSLPELIAYAKANPGKLRFGSPGSGSSQHLSGELFKSMAGVDLQHIPYKSSAQMTTELVSGQFEMSFQNAPLILPFVKAGKLKALAVTTKTRIPMAPDIPTLDETGGDSGLKGYEVGGGSGLLAPRGTPPEVLRKFETDVRAALNTPSVREQYAANGLIAVGSSAQEFGAYLKSEIARWAPVIRATGAQVD